MPKRSAPRPNGGGNGNGTGYAGDARNDATRRKKLQKKTHANDIKIAQAQECQLNAALASLSRGSTPDTEWMNVLKSVLRNQADWSSSSKSGRYYQLYKTALECCDGIVRHCPKYLGKEDDNDSVLSALSEMVSTAQIVLKHPQDYSREVQILAQQVLDLKHRASKESRLVLETEDLQVVDNRAHYRQMLRPYAFDFAVDLPNHYFAKNTTSSSIISPKQRQCILKELGTYPTALPVEYGSGIFVRAVESRMDLLRCLILGPDGSPYASGAFFFDIWLSNYPSSPPKVQFLTTEGGKYRFNPNLYNDGKVCLSLLGTWAGPGWQPGESTLQQVLVSIQSLILVQDPYFNEPFQDSEGTEGGSSASKNYNSKIQRYTMDAAILPHLQRIANVVQTTSPYPEFDEILEKHFELKQHTWKKQLSDWRRSANEVAAHPPTYQQGRTTVVHAAMEPLYLSCVSAWESRPTRKQTARKTSTHSLTNIISTVNAVEVNGVIEIDLEENNSIALKPRASIDMSVARAPSAVASLQNEDEVIDLT